MNKQLLSLLFALLAITFARAQRITISEPINLKNDYSFELIGRFEENLVLFRDRLTEFELQIFDSQMRHITSKQLSNLGRANTRVLDVIGNSSDFVVLFHQKKKGRFLLKANKYDFEGTIIDSITIKDYGENVFSPPILELCKSEDKKMVAVYNVADYYHLDILCFEVDRMRVRWNQVLITDSNAIPVSLQHLPQTTWSSEKTDRFDLASVTTLFALSNDAKFFCLADVNNRKGRLEKHSLKIIALNSEASHAFEVPVSEFLSADIQIKVDNYNRRLIIAGLIADKIRDRVVGVFSVFLDCAANVTTLSTQRFDSQMLTILQHDENIVESSGIYHAKLSSIIQRQDGGYLLIGEIKEEIQRGASAGRGFWRDGARLVVDYYYDDIFVLAVDSIGSNQWSTVLHKKQYSQDDEGVFSSIFVLLQKKQLMVLFNDDIKYENTCSAYVIFPDGRYDRNSLMNTAGLGLRLRFRDAWQLSATECIVPSEYRNKLRLVRFMFDVD